MIRATDISVRALVVNWISDCTVAPQEASLTPGPAIPLLLDITIIPNNSQIY